MRQGTRKLLRTCAALALSLVTVLSLSTTAFAGRVEIDTSIPMIDVRELKTEWKKDQTYTLADPAPWDPEELKQVVDVQDPRSVAAYWVWAVNRLVDDYDDGMGMMKYLFADIEPFGPGFTEGGMSGRAGWSTYFNERLKSADYRWLPRAFFEGGTAANGFRLSQPLSLELYYNSTNTETINAQTLDPFGRLNIVYWVKSHAGGHQMNITLSKFRSSDRWYVTSGTSSTALFYDQRFALKTEELTRAKAEILDYSTAADHEARYAPAQTPAQGSVEGETAYSGTTVHPFTDVDSAASFAPAVAWAYDRGVTRGVAPTLFGGGICTRSQAVTFLWAAAGRPPAGGELTFSDVAEDAYYRQALLWAAEQGILRPEGPFSPHLPCSGEDFIAFLYAASGLGAGDQTVQAREWAARSGLLEGTGLTGELTAPCSRTDAVVLLHRICGM